MVHGEICGPMEKRGDECRMEGRGTRAGTETKASIQTDRVGCGSERGGVGRNNMDCGTERRRIPCFGCGSIFGGKTG